MKFHFGTSSICQPDKIFRPITSFVDFTTETIGMNPGACFTKHLKPKIFISSIHYGTYENLGLKMFSETSTSTCNSLGFSKQLTDVCK